MFTSFMNEVKFEVGTIVVLTDEFRALNRPLLKIEPLLKTSDEFMVTAIKKSNATDEHTDLSSPTIGATKLTHIKTGKVFDIDDTNLDEKDEYWAFFTSFVPDAFIIKGQVSK